MLGRAGLREAGVDHRARGDRRRGVSLRVEEALVLQEHQALGVHEVAVDALGGVLAELLDALGHCQIEKVQRLLLLEAVQRVTLAQGCC